MIMALSGRDPQHEGALDIPGARRVDRAMNTTENTDPQVTSVRDSILDKLGRKVSERRYCDIGPHAGEWRIHVGTLYLTDDELRAVDHL
jgi:hypothetical protein